jgi:hypothetical protein
MIIGSNLNKQPSQIKQQLFIFFNKNDAILSSLHFSSFFYYHFLASSVLEVIRFVC